MFSINDVVCVYGDIGKVQGHRVESNGKIIDNVVCFNNGSAGHYLDEEMAKITVEEYNKDALFESIRRILDKQSEIDDAEKYLLENLCPILSDFEIKIKNADNKYKRLGEVLDEIRIIWNSIDS